MNSKISQYDVVELLEDLNENIKKGMIGTALEIYDSGNVFEVEFLDSNGRNYMHEDQLSFQIKREQLKLKC